MKKFLLKTSLAIATLLASTTTSAHDFEVDGIFYNFNDSTPNTVAVTYQGSSGTSYSDEYVGNITIPTSVTYSGTTYLVTSIEDMAFYRCTGLTSVTIPNSVLTLGTYVFKDCTGLTEVNFNAENCTMLGSSPVFYGCSNLKTANIGENVKKIPDYLFWRCAGLTSVTIPSSVKVIGRRAFMYCTSLTELTIPNSVVTIDNLAFYGCSGLKQVTIGNSVTTIKTQAFYMCTGLTSMEIPNSVTTIETYAFQGCTGLTEVTIPNSVTALGENIFIGCTGLSAIVVEKENPIYDSRNNCNAIIESATNTLIAGCKNTIIPNSVTSIERRAFSGCTGLTSVTIPNSVTVIHSVVFEDCTGLTTIRSLNTEPPICYDGCFTGVDVANCVLEVPAGAKEAYASANYWCEFVNIVEIAVVEVSTQENNAIFNIPTTQGAVSYTVNVYSDEAMTQLVATTNYDASGNIVPLSTSLDLSIDGFEGGTYYYKVEVKAESGDVLNSYMGAFEIVTTGIENLPNDVTTAVEVARYDIHGRMLSAPTKGINIVKYSDGTVKKLIIKN